MYCYDLRQLNDMKNKPNFPEMGGKNIHNALQDAIWNEKLYNYLIGN